MSKLKSSSSGNITVENLSMCNKLNTYDWLKDLNKNSRDENIVEVQFKNTRKDFFTNTEKIRLAKGDLVTVGAESGHDIGIVTLTGILASLQYKKRTSKIEPNSLKKVYRKANLNDIQKWKVGKNSEEPTMLKAREITGILGLEMKISDVEYQGDHSKATFYYIADGRVDFRELIKVLKQEFGVKIEMKQIGARQEAGRVGGLGSCGRELCCSTWKTEFGTVTIDSARYQNLSTVSQKYAGQCGKLKCCLMYELDTYMEAWEEFPDELLELETKKGTAYKIKIDVLKKVIWYSYKTNIPADPVPLDINTVKKIIMMNKKGLKPVDLDNI